MTILHANTVNKTSFQEVLLQGSIPCEKIWCVNKYLIDGVEHIKVLTSLDHKALCYIKRIIKRVSFHIFKLFKKPEILKGTSKNMIQLSNLVENHVYFPFYFLIENLILNQNYLEPRIIDRVLFTAFLMHNFFPFLENIL